MAQGTYLHPHEKELETSLKRKVQQGGCSGTFSSQVLYSTLLEAKLSPSLGTVTPYLRSKAHVSICLYLVLSEI